jgi:SAM-dependent methyltransferase
MEPRIAHDVTRSNGIRRTLALPHPIDPSRFVAWNGEAFELDGNSVRVLSYDVSPSGWTEELTQLHEEMGRSDHFIDVASRAHAIDEVERCVTRPSSIVLEIGVSSGFLLRELIMRLQGHLIVGADYTRGTLNVLGARLANVPLIQFDLTRCPLPDNFADLVVLLNVLEHIEDHVAAVGELYRIIRPGGTVIIEVPAGAPLFDVYDRVLMHCRRYNMLDLIALLRDAGFIVERRSHLGFFLYPLFYLSKHLNQRRYPPGDTAAEHQIVSRMISVTRKSTPLTRHVMGLERLLRPHFYYPWGVRCLVTCRKPMPPKEH